MTDNTTGRTSDLEVEPMRRAGAPQGVASGALSALRDIWGRRELLDSLIKRELKSRYKDSALGFVWSVIRPLVMLAVYYVALGQFLGAARGVQDFAVFIYSGLTIWTFFSETVTAGTASIVNNSGLIKKVYLPREIFPIAVTGSTLFNFGIQLVILVGATLVVGRPPTWSSLIYFPVALLIAVVWAQALSLVLSAWNVYLRDIGYLVEVFIMVFFWASPIVYAWSMVQDKVSSSWLVEAYLANPMTLAVLGFQQSFWIAGGQSVTMSDGTVLPPHLPPDHLMTRMLIVLAIGIVALWASQRTFSRLQANFAQEL